MAEIPDPNQHQINFALAPGRSVHHSEIHAAEKPAVRDSEPHLALPRGGVWMCVSLLLLLVELTLRYLHAFFNCYLAACCVNMCCWINTLNRSAVRPVGPQRARVKLWVWKPLRWTKAVNPSLVLMNTFHMWGVVLFGGEPTWRPKVMREQISALCTYHRIVLLSCSQLYLQNIGLKLKAFWVQLQWDKLISL